jgi:hypothetical protein
MMPRCLVEPLLLLVSFRPAHRKLQSHASACTARFTSISLCMCSLVPCILLLSSKEDALDRSE